MRLCVSAVFLRAGQLNFECQLRLDKEASLRAFRPCRRRPKDAINTWENLQEARFEPNLTNHAGLAGSADRLILDGETSLSGKGAGKAAG